MIEQGPKQASGEVLKVKVTAFCIYKSSKYYPHPAVVIKYVLSDQCMQ